MSNVLLNFRDISKNTSVGDGIVYRGRALTESEMDEKDRKFIDGLGIRHIIDFRSDEEIGYKGRYYVPEGAEYHHISAIKGNMNANLDTSIERDVMVERILEMAYRRLPFENEAYRFLVECIVNGETPVYINCSAGKDRTGVGAMIAEVLLGASKEEIYKDYLESHDNYYHFYHDVMKYDDIPRPTLCYREWLDGTIEEIMNRYGSFDEYLINEYHLSKDRIRELRESNR